MKDQVVKDARTRQITSPDQLHDYLHVTSAAVWIVMAAIILLLVVSLIWSSQATIESYADATAKVSGRSMIVRIDDPKLQNEIKSGMKIVVGNTETKVASVGHDENGNLFAVAGTTLSNGTYSARIVYRQTKVLSLLFN
ncbi:MAG: hypothetical protein ABS901_03570 [Candidatus Limivicinus sp.]|jgi:hypothetical protein